MTFLTGAAYFTLIQLHTFRLRGIDIPGHVPHTEWVSVLFIQGTSQNSQQSLSNALYTDTSHEKWITIANIVKDNVLLFYPECIHNNPLRSFAAIPAQATAYIGPIYSLLDVQRPHVSSLLSGFEGWWHVAVCKAARTKAIHVHSMKASTISLLLNPKESDVDKTCTFGQSA